MLDHAKDTGRNRRKNFQNARYPDYSNVRDIREEGLARKDAPKGPPIKRREDGETTRRRGQVWHPKTLAGLPGGKGGGEKALKPQREIFGARQIRAPMGP